MPPSGEPFDSELGRLFDLSLDAFCIAGFDGYLKLVNPAFARILGYTEEELLARPFIENVHPDDVDAAQAVLADLADGKDILGFQCRQVCADGSVRWFEWNTSPQPEAGVVYGVARDVTDRRIVADELGALRRVATLVAEGVQPQDLFAVVAEEVALFMHVPFVNVARYENDGGATHCASVSPDGPAVEVGTRWSLEGDSVLRRVRDTAEPARMDDYSKVEGEIGHAVRRIGVASTVGSPIVVAGGVWGVMLVSSPEQLPADTAGRLADFTELMATALANAESREALQKLAGEQAALRRMATLVAQGVRPAELFSAVSDEVAELFGTDAAAVVRFDDAERALVFVGVSKSERRTIPVGTRWDLTEERFASARVHRTGRPARMDERDWTSLPSTPGKVGRELGLISTVAAPIIVEGHAWGAMSVSSSATLLPHDTEERLQKFTELVATAIANAESRSELAASRRRIVTASDEARRRIERDLHDGTQQRLVSLQLAVRAAEAQVEPEQPDLQGELSRVATGLADAVEEVREISRGIHPAILSEGGLGPALRTLARRSSIPVELEVAHEARAPEPIEVAAYFVASEALANATKHAQASKVEVSLAQENGGLLLFIRDDGVGGADPARGSGLVGLNDRVEALGGSVTVSSRPGEGTQVAAELPLEPDVEPEV